MKNVRNSSVEALKIFAIMTIVLSHAIPSSINLSLATEDIKQLVLVFFKYGGQLGNDIFIVASSWYLLERKKVSSEKIIHIIGDSFIFSVGIMVVFLVAGVMLSPVEIIKQFIPITMNANWFIGCYIIFYMISPAMNKVIAMINKEQHFCYISIMFVLYIVIQTLFRDRYYYNQLIGFVCIYFITAFMKRYMITYSNSKSLNKRVLLFTALLFVLSIFIINEIGLKISLFSNYLTNGSVITNPFLLLISFSLFNIARCSMYYNSVINKISSLSLLIYIIHANRLIQDILKPHIVDKMFKYSFDSQPIISVTILGGGGLVASIGIAFLYQKMLQKKFYVVCNWIAKICNLLYYFISKRVFKYLCD